MSLPAQLRCLRTENRLHPSLGRPYRVSEGGFTLIELLVVIAIIALLAAFLFPVFLQSRRKARQAECQSHLLQFGHAFSMYAGDWDETLPAPGGLFGERTYWDQGHNTGVDAYLRNRAGSGSVWTCPELDLSNWDSRWEARSYTMNTFLRDPPDVEPYKEAIKIEDGIELSAVPAPAATILLFEGTQSITGDANTGFGYIYRDGDWTQMRGYWHEAQKNFRDANLTWHSGQDNFLFVDGHVKALPPDPQEPNRPTAGHDLWHVNKA